MQISQKGKVLLAGILGSEGARKRLASLEEKAQLAEKKRASGMKPSGEKPLAEGLQTEIKSCVRRQVAAMRNADAELFRAIRGRLLLRAISAIDGGASPDAIYHHPAQDAGWSFCPQYEGKTALQVALLEQSIEPNDVKKEKLGKIIGFLNAKKK